MMNRVGLGLAMGAGYVLGRTKKMKLAFAVGSLVAGKRLNLGPRALADLVNQQLRDNPQFKEIGDQLREDLRGVGKAASGAMVERQMNTLADRLHGQTAQVRDQLAGVVPDISSLPADENEDQEPGKADEETEPEAREASQTSAKGVAKKKAPARTPTRNAARKAPVRKGAPKRTSARKTTAAGSGSSGRPQRPKGGGGQ